MDFRIAELLNYAKTDSKIPVLLKYDLSSDVPTEEFIDSFIWNNAQDIQAEFDNGETDIYFISVDFANERDSFHTGVSNFLVTRTRTYYSGAGPEGDTITISGYYYNNADGISKYEKTLFMQGYKPFELINFNTSSESISSATIPTIDIGAYPSCSNKGSIHFSTQTVMEQTKDFFTTNFDSIVSKMEDNGYDMAKIHGILSDVEPDHSYFIITKLNFSTSWNDASNGVILKIECPADIYTNSLYTPNSASQILILYCGNYYDNDVPEHAIGNYIIQNSNSTPRYPTYKEIPYSFKNNHRTYMEEILRTIQPLLVDFSKFMDNRGTDIMKVDFIMEAVFPDNSYGNGEEITIKRNVIHSSGSGYTYLFTISCHNDTQFNDLKGFGKIHEEGYASFYVYDDFHKYNNISDMNTHFSIIQISDNERIFYPKSITISTAFNDYGGGEDNMDATLPILYIEKSGDIIDSYPIKNFIEKDHIINFTPYESMRMYIGIDKAQGCDWIDLIKNEDTVFRMDTGTTTQSPYYDFQEEDDGLNFIIKYSSNLQCP